LIKYDETEGDSYWLYPFMFLALPWLKEREDSQVVKLDTNKSDT
jgi:hypothetical protein